MSPEHVFIQCIMEATFDVHIKKDRLCIQNEGASNMFKTFSQFML